MAREYLVVLFSSKRRVKINGQFMGYTNTKLELEGGRYEVTLGPPANFSPEAQAIDLKQTASLQPMTIEFKKVEQ
ncbi:PEGA domain-containing protein [Desulfonatronovibrio hydrogenovorans]|uniref:PEGA domain-containing protein n=1 Tax=Desulfonatronovibrio hydrogenovorans TaxID=53245 RepID=UPI00055824BA|nr:PEGA domain-containing protein [Desulfonatronovibrio hydrogenovorans]